MLFVARNFLSVASPRPMRARALTRRPRKRFASPLGAHEPAGSPRAHYLDAACGLAGETLLRRTPTQLSYFLPPRPCPEHHHKEREPAFYFRFPFIPMKTLPQLDRRVNLIEQSIVSDCCGAPVVRMKNETYGCIWCGSYCCEDEPVSCV